MLSPEELGRLQREQHKHDMRNHLDIVSLHKADRLKHYGLHFAKYVGRLARGTDEAKSVEVTFVDALLVGLSAANTLLQDLSKEPGPRAAVTNQVDPLRSFADAAGRFADACEKIDHLEEFSSIAREANRDIIYWTIRAAHDRNFDIKTAIQSRRKVLGQRAFYIES